MRFEKKDLEASLECCFGDVLVGDEGVSGISLILGDVGAFSTRTYMSCVAACVERTGDRGGDLGERGDCAGPAATTSLVGKLAVSFRGFPKFNGETLAALPGGMLMQDVHDTGRNADCRAAVLPRRRVAVLPCQIAAFQTRQDATKQEMVRQIGERISFVIVDTGFYEEIEQAVLKSRKLLIVAVLLFRLHAEFVSVFLLVCW